MRPLGARPSTAERGQTTAEYLGVVVVIAALIAALFLGGVGSRIADGFSRALCTIIGQACPAPTTTAEGPITVDIALLRNASPGEPDGCWRTCPPTNGA